MQQNHHQQSKGTSNEEPGEWNPPTFYIPQPPVATTAAAARGRTTNPGEQIGPSPAQNPRSPPDPTPASAWEAREPPENSPQFPARPTDRPRRGCSGEQMQRTPRAPIRRAPGGNPARVLARVYRRRGIGDIFLRSSRRQLFFSSSCGRRGTTRVLLLCSPAPLDGGRLLISARRTGAVAPSTGNGSPQLSQAAVARRWLMGNGGESRYSRSTSAGEGGVWCDKAPTIFFREL